MLSSRDLTLVPKMKYIKKKKRNYKFLSNITSCCTKDIGLRCFNDDFSSLIEQSKKKEAFYNISSRKSLHAIDSLQWSK